MIWRIPGISLNLHYPKEDDGELYTACPIIKGSRGIEPLNPLPQRRIRLTLPAYLCLKTALRRSEIREYYSMGFGTLPAPLAYPDVAGFLPVAFDAVAFQHQMTVIDTDITGKSACGYSALSAYLRNREVGGSVQLQRRAVFRFRLRLAASCPVTWLLRHCFPRFISGLPASCYVAKWYMCRFPSKKERRWCISLSYLFIF